MKISFLMIINQKNYYECITTMLSVWGQKNWDDEYQVIFIYSDLDKHSRKAVSQFMSEKMNVVFLKDTDVVQEQYIYNLDLNKIRKFSGRFFFIQSKVLVRKNIDYLYDKYKNAVTAGKNIKRCFSDDEEKIQKYEWGFVSIDMGALPEGVNCLREAEERNLIHSFELEDYFYIHPMISLQEVNNSFDTSYENLDLVESEAAVVRLYSSIETRLREYTMPAKEWSYYFKSIPQSSKKIGSKLDKQVLRSGIVFKRANTFEVEAGIIGIPLVKKRYTSSGYVLRILNIPFVKQKNIDFFKKTYFLGIRVCKEFNFAYVDQLFVERASELARGIGDANRRLMENYAAKNNMEMDNMIIDTEKLMSKADSLILYDLFKSLKDGSVNKQKEIEFDLVQAKGE